MEEEGQQDKQRFTKYYTEKTRKLQQHEPH